MSWKYEPAIITSDLVSFC